MSRYAAVRWATALACGLAIIWAMPKAVAATWYWDTTTTGLWADGANWSDNPTSGGTTGTVPASDTTTDVAQFNQSTINGNQTVQLNADRSIGGIIVANTGSTSFASDSATARLLTLGASGITVNSGAGSVTIGSAANLVNLAIATSSTFAMNAGSRTLTINGGISRSAGDTTSRMLTIAGNATTGTVSITGPISNGGASGNLGLTMAGAGTLLLSGTNTYTGTTFFDAGTVQGSANATTFSNVFSGNGDFTFRGGTLALVGAGSANLGTRIKNSSSAVRLATNNLSAGLTATIDSSNVGGFVKAGLGGVTLAGDSTYSGATSVNAGSITLTGSLNTSTTVTLGSGVQGVTFTLGSASGAVNQEIAGLTTAGSGVNSVRGGHSTNISTLTVNIASGSTSTYAGGLGGSAAAGNLGLTKAGNGTFVLSGSNSYVGSTRINAGTLLLNNENALGGSGTITFGGGVLRYSGSNSVDYSARIASSGSAIAVDTNGQAIVFGSALASTNTSGLTKSGSGRLSLNVANLYSGVTTISAGTLALGVDGSFANSPTITVGDAGSSGVVLDLTAKTSGFTFLSSQTLKGIGTIQMASGQALTINGTLAAGNSPGTLTIEGGDLVLGLSSITNYEISGTDNTVGGGINDLTRVAGSLTLGGTLNVAASPAFDLFGSRTYRVFDYATGGSGSLAGSMVIGSKPDANYLYSLNTATSGQVNLFVQRRADQGTTFTMTTGTVTRALVNSTVALSGSVSNTSPANSAALSLGLGSTGQLTVTTFTTGSVTAASSLAVSGSINAGSTLGSRTWTVVNTDTNAITTTSTATGSLTVVADRTFTTPSIAFGRFLNTTNPLSGTSRITSTGDSGTTASSTIGGFGSSNGLTLSLAGGTNAFTGLVTTQTATYTTSGSYSGALGGFSGSFQATATNEFSGTSTVTVAYTGTSVQERTYTSPATINLGRVLIGSSAVGSGTVTSTQSFETTATGTLGGYAGGAINGVGLSGTGGVFNGSNTSATYSLTGNVSGTAGQAVGGTFSLASTNEFGTTTGSAANVSFTGTTVAQRQFSVSNSGTINLGNFLRTASVTGSTTIESSGLYATTASATLGAFSGTSTNGFSLGLATGTNVFNGGSALQQAIYTLSGSAASAGAINGSFTSPVTAELGSMSPLSVALVGTAYDPATAVLASGGSAFGNAWTISLGEFNQGSGTSTPWNFAIANQLVSEFYTAELVLDSFSTTLDSGAIFMSLSGTSSFPALVAGGTNANSYTAWMSLANAGAFTNTYQLTFKSAKDGQVLGGSQNVTLTVTGIIVVPEPGALALACIGIAAVAWAARRR